MSERNLPTISAPAFQPRVDREAPVISAPPFSPLATRVTEEPAPPAEPPRVLSPGEQARDVATAAAMGLGRGVVGIPGLPGSLAQAYDIAPIGMSYYLSRATGTSREEAQRAYDEAMGRLRATQTPREQAGLERRIFGIPFPTSEAVVQAVAPSLQYEAQTPAGRIVGVGTEFLGGSPATAPVKFARAIAGLPAALRFGRTEALPAVAGGVTSGGLGEATRGGEYESLARVTGALGGAGAASVGQARFLPGSQEDAAARLAGDIARRQLTEQPSTLEQATRAFTGRLPASERAVIERLEVPPGEYAPGVTPTPAQLLPEEPGIRGLELRRPVEGAPTAAAQRGASRAALAEEASLFPSFAAEARVAPTMSEVLGLPVGNNPMGQSSTAARSVFDAVHDAAFTAKEDAWNHPAISQARYRTDRVVSAIDNAVQRMGPATYENMPVELRRYVENIQNHGANGVPLTELQKIKTFANEIMRNPNVMDKSGAAALTTLLDDVMTDTNNVMPRFMSGTTYAEAAPAWDAARTATRQYYNNFGTDLLQNLAERYRPGTAQAGQPVVPAVQMLDRVLGSPRDALANFEQLYAIPGIDRAALNAAVGDWIVGKLTDNGQRIDVSASDIAKFIRSPGNAEIVSRIPGLQDRLENIGTQSRVDRVIGGFDRVLQNPDPRAVSNFIRNNRTDLEQIFTTPAQQQYLTRLERSSDILHDLGQGALTPNKLERFLERGDLFSVLHGWHTGIFGRMAAGATAGAAIGTSGVLGAGLELAGLGAGLGALSGIPGPTAALSRVVYGPLQANATRILQEATTNPRLMQELLRKPTIEDIFNPLSVNGWAHFLTETAPGTAVTGTRGAQETINQPAEQPRFAGGRVGRASGGRLMRRDHATQAAALIRAADAAKKTHNKTTEGILDQPDEVVAKALSIANKAI